MVFWLQKWPQFFPSSYVCLSQLLPQRGAIEFLTLRSRLHLGLPLAKEVTEARGYQSGAQVSRSLWAFTCCLGSLSERAPWEQGRASSLWNESPRAAETRQLSRPCWGPRESPPTAAKPPHWPVLAHRCGSEPPPSPAQISRTSKSIHRLVHKNACLLQDATVPLGLCVMQHDVSLGNWYTIPFLATHMHFPSPPSSVEEQ